MFAAEVITLEIFSSNMEEKEQRSKLVYSIVSDYSLKSLIDLDAWEKLQDSIAAATGTAMVTVDYKGNPLTKTSSFSEFCNERRKIPVCEKNCFFSDAYGSLKAAMLNAPYMFHCPAGLVDCAVPIIVEGNHLGAVLMGQVRVSGDTSSLEDVKKLVQNEIDLNEYPKLKKLYDENRVVDVDQLRRTADLVKLLIDEMVQKQLLLKLQDELYKLIAQLKDKVAVLRNGEDRGQSDSARQSVGPFMLSALNMLNSMAIVEGADGTSEAIGIYAQMLEYIYDAEDGFISIQSEVNFIQNSVEILKRQFKRDIEMAVNVDYALSQAYIPPCTLYPFVENAIIHGILPLDGDEAGRIDVEISKKRGKIICEIADNGVGMSDDQLEIMEFRRSKPESRQLSNMDIISTRRRLEKIYGENGASVELAHNPSGKGMQVRISWSPSI